MMNRIGFGRLLIIFVAIFSYSFYHPMLPWSRAFGTAENFHGSVSMNGRAVDNGTRVAAKLSGTEAGNTTTFFAYYSMDVGGQECANCRVDFYVAGLKADQTALYSRGDRVNLNLTVTTQPLTSLALFPSQSPALSLMLSLALLAAPRTRKRQWVTLSSHS